MRFYKVIKDDGIIGVISQYDFMRYNNNKGFIAYADEETGQFVQCNDKYYTDNWLRALDNKSIKVEQAKIISIDADEYEVLAKAFEIQDEIPYDEPEEQEEIPEVTPDMSLEQIKEVKLAEINKECSKYITDGFDLTLSDGNTHHFSLSTNDQLNLITLSTMVASGQEMIPYHADGELCAFFPINDVTAILEMATQHKTFHTTYCNSLRNYVKSLDNLQDIGAVYYGMDVPEEFKSDVYKYLVK